MLVVPVRAVVGDAGLEPAEPKAPDLQSGPLPVTEYSPIYCGNFLRGEVYQPKVPLFRYSLQVTKRFPKRPHISSLLFIWLL